MARAGVGPESFQSIPVGRHPACLAVPPAALLVRSLMKAFFRPVLLAACLPVLAFPLSAQEERVAGGVFVTLGGFEVKPLTGNDPQTSEQAPDLPAPTRFNLAFDRPATVWRASEGRFVSFLAGETGGALFFAEEKATGWEMLVEGRVEQLRAIGNKRYLATGGTMQMERMTGTVHLVSMDHSGKWQVRRIYESHLGVPRIIGTTSLQAADGSAVALVVFELDTKGAYPVDAIQGVASDGTVHYLGRRLKEATAAAPARVPGFWTPGNFREVKAYLFDPEKGKTRSIIEDGKLHPGVVDSPGARMLVGNQPERLLTALSGKEGRSPSGRYEPHHGFVLYDKEGSILGHITVSLGSKNGVAVPPATDATDWDMEAIANIIRETGLPILANEEEYRRYFLYGPDWRNQPAAQGESR